MYDTQCGAKRLHAATAAALFELPFASRWAFDVEFLARLVREREARRLPAEAKAIYEYPLPIGAFPPAGALGISW